MTKNVNFEKTTQQIEDLIGEVNDPVIGGGDSEKNNLDRIKHILKRIGFQQAAIDFKTAKTNRLLIILTAVAAIPAIDVIARFINFIIELCK